MTIVLALARNPTVFPLLGLGDPQDQAVLTLRSPISESMSRYHVCWQDARWLLDKELHRGYEITI